MNIFSNRQKMITYCLKLIVIVSSFVGVLLSALASMDTFMGGSTVFMYFTIQSNIAIGLICLCGCILLLLNKNIPYAWGVIKFVGTVSITLTGFVFTFVLAPTLGSNAWTLANVLTHLIVPIVSIIDFFVVGVNLEFKNRDVIYIIIPPLLYAIYAGIGYALNWKFSTNTNYPYFFLNWGSKAGAFGFSNELPFMGVVYWILLLLGFLILVGYCYLFILKKIRAKIKNR